MCFYLILPNAFAIIQIVRTKWRKQEIIKITGESELLKFRRRLVTSILLLQFYQIDCKRILNSDSCIHKLGYILFTGARSRVRHGVRLPLIYFCREPNYETQKCTNFRTPQIQIFKALATTNNNNNNCKHIALRSLRFLEYLLREITLDFLKQQISMSKFKINYKKE